MTDLSRQHQLRFTELAARGRAHSDIRCSPSRRWRSSRRPSPTRSRHIHRDRQHWRSDQPDLGDNLSTAGASASIFAAAMANRPLIRLATHYRSTAAGLLVATVLRLQAKIRTSGLGRQPDPSASAAAIIPQAQWSASAITSRCCNRPPGTAGAIIADRHRHVPVLEFCRYAAAGVILTSKCSSSLVPAKSSLAARAAKPALSISTGAVLYFRGPGKNRFSPIESLPSYRQARHRPATQ